MTMMAEYFCGRDEGYLILADARSEEPEITPFPLDPLFDEISEYFQHLIGAGGSEVGMSLQSIVQPVVERTREDELIWIIPHVILHYLPFHAIPTRDGILGFRNPVCYGPSASVLPLCRSGPRLSGKAVVTLGDPTGDLIYARREAMGVAETFDADLLVGERGTKQRLFSTLDTYKAVDIIHFACHGRVGAEDPFQSGVLLAPDPADRTRGPDLLSSG